MGKVVNLLTGQKMEILKNRLLSDIKKLNGENDSIKFVVLDICEALKNYVYECDSCESKVSSSCHDASYNIEWLYQHNYLNEDDLTYIKKILENIINLIDKELSKEKEIDRYEARLLDAINIFPDRELAFEIKIISREIATKLKKNEKLYSNSKCKEKKQETNNNGSKSVKKTKTLEFGIPMDYRLEQMLIKSEDCDLVKLYIPLILDTLDEIAVNTDSEEIESKCDEAYDKISSLNNNTDLSKSNIAKTIKNINDIIGNLINLIYEEEEKEEEINSYETRLLKGLKIIPDQDLASRLQLMSRKIAKMLEENEIFYINPDYQDNKPQVTNLVKSAQIISFDQGRCQIQSDVTETKKNAKIIPFSRPQGEDR